MTARTLPVITVRSAGRPTATVSSGSPLAMSVNGTAFSLARVIFEMVTEAGDHLVTEADNRLVLE